MTKHDAALAKMRAICLALPDTAETLTWGTPHFRVAGKIFAGCGEDDGRPVIGFKLEKAHQEAVLADPMFTKAPYVGQHGWVQVDGARIRNWKAIESMVLESYRLIAPKKSLAKLASAAPVNRPKPKARKAR